MSTPFSDTADAFVYAMSYIGMKEAKEEICKTTGIKDLFQQKWTNQMGCRNFEDRLRELKHCGCPRCRDEYHRLERNYHERGRQYYDDYNRPSRALSYNPLYLTADFAASQTKETKVEEPKNYALKLLVDQLKSQQIELGAKNNNILADKTVIKTYQASLKVKNTEKLAIENKIKELAGALKKLGHKE